MSDTVPPKPVKIHKLPFVIKKNTITSYDKLKPNYELLFRCVKNASQNLFKEDIIYKSNEHDIFNGKYPDLIITNTLNILRNTIRTVATYKGEDSSIVELSSDAVTRVIGQKNYNTVFSALCSVISQDLKVQGILSLLTLDSKVSTKNVNEENVNVQSVERASQTDQTSREILMRDKKRRRMKKKQVRSYVFKDEMLPDKHLKKIIIHPDKINSVESDQIKIEWEEKSVEKNDTEKISNNNEKDETSNNQLLDLKHILNEHSKLILNEDSNMSDTSIGTIGSCNIPNILENPNSILMNIDKYTKEFDADNLTTIKMIDGSVVMIRGNPDKFHLSSPEILEHLSPQDRKKIRLHQAYIDWKFCLESDEDDNLPIHWAVLNKDVDLLKRQCIVLKSRQESVDITSGGKLTSLQLSLLNDCTKCTAVLLSHGADPLIPDEESRTPLHLAAEVSSENVQALIDHCRANAREILQDNEGLWKDHFENKPDKDLADYLMYKMCTMCDNQGYTPLMLASRIGNYENVKLLIQAAPGAINMGMPNSGNTALYLSVSAACLDCHERGNKTVVATKFMDTIGALLENGADPSIDNNSGTNVNILLTEFAISKLSMLVANKLTSAKYFDGNKLKNFDSYMLIKDEDGKLNLKELKDTKVKPKSEVKIEIATAKNELKQENAVNNNESKINENIVIVEPKLKAANKKMKKRKPVILQDIPVVTNLVPVTHRNRPLILKKMKPVSKVTAVPVINEMHKIIINPKNLIPVKRVDVNMPIKFVKILPKIDLTSATSSISITCGKKRRASSKSDQSTKKSKK